MGVSNTNSVEQFKVAGRFENLRRTLCSERYTSHLDKPLAYWALPSDRRLPLALLGRTLEDLLALPFGEIAATPGIGRKKIDSLVRLLARAADTEPESLSADPGGNGQHRDDPWAGADPSEASSNGFDPAKVSEVVWRRWREAVIQHGWEDEPLGKLAPTLRNLNRASWTVPLGWYAHSTLAEIRAMKTHGQRRIDAILEVFHGVQKHAAGGNPTAHLALRVRPAWIDAAERWIGRELASASMPTDQEVRDGLLRPMLGQLCVDAAAPIVELAENRLGLGGPITSVREAARTMGLTRARIYQLLGEISEIFAVRWPLGRALLWGLCDHLAVLPAPAGLSEGLSRLRTAADLFFPAVHRIRGAVGADDEPDADAFR